MVQYNGYNACAFCHHPGVLVKQPKSKKQVVRYIKRDVEDPLRSHQEIIRAMYNTRTQACPDEEQLRGVQALSCMIAFTNFDLIFGFGQDYMHSVLLGILPKLFGIWFKSNKGKPYKINQKDKVELNLTKPKIDFNKAKFFCHSEASLCRRIQAF